MLISMLFLALLRLKLDDLVEVSSLQLSLVSCEFVIF